LVKKNLVLAIPKVLGKSWLTMGHRLVEQQRRVSECVYSVVF